MFEEPSDRLGNERLVFAMRDMPGFRQDERGSTTCGDAVRVFGGIVFIQRSMNGDNRSAQSGDCSIESPVSEFRREPGLCPGVGNPAKGGMGLTGREYLVAAMARSWQQSWHVELYMPLHAREFDVDILSRSATQSPSIHIRLAFAVAPVAGFGQPPFHQGNWGCLWESTGSR